MLLCTPAFGQAATIYDSWNTGFGDNNPTCSPIFTILEPQRITYIDTYHWNYGKGAPGGTIGLRKDDGTLYGPWNVETTPGSSGVPNANWIAHPNVILSAGSYTVEDSDPATWTQNSESPCGFTKVMGVPETSDKVIEDGCEAVEGQPVPDDVGGEKKRTSAVSVHHSQIDSDKCSKASGYWKLINGEIITVQENYPDDEYTGNFINNYYWNGGLNDDLDGEIEVKENVRSKWDKTWYSTIEYTVKWDAPQSVLYPGYELNIPLTIVASKKAKEPGQINWDGRNWYLEWRSDWAEVPYQYIGESYNHRGSGFNFPEQSFSGTGPFSGTRIFHWHGDSVNGCGPTAHTGPESMMYVESIGAGREGDKRFLKMGFPSGPVIMYNYTWVKDCDGSQEGADTADQWNSGTYDDDSHLLDDLAPVGSYRNPVPETSGEAAKRSIWNGLGPLFAPGASWIVKEYGQSGSWDGEWVVRDDVKTIDASWSGGLITDIIDIQSIEGDQITLFRHGNSGYYTGTISADGSSIEGTASWKPGELWEVSLS